MKPKPGSPSGEGREIILANLNHTSPSRPGMTFDRGRINDMVIARAGAPEGYVQKRWTEGQVEYYDDPWGNLWVRMQNGSVKGEIFQPAIQEWSQLDYLPMPVYDREKTAERLRAGFGDDPRFRAAAIGGWVFDSARYLRRLEIYLMDLALYPEELKRLHTKVCATYETLVRAAGESGADAIVIGEDMGTQQGLLFSPEMFREFFKPDYTRLMGMAHEYGMKVLMHSCGSNRQILDDLIDCGVDCFQFDQPAIYDMDELAALFRRRKATLWSPVDIQQVLPTGDRDYIVSETRRMCTTFDGCLIVKNYPDLHGIGVTEEWDDWAYETVVEYANEKQYA
jgi:uroporphyrinogen decarboxylase